LTLHFGVGTRQRLAAILAADAAGYSRLMAAAEQATLVALDEARDVFRTQIESHGGRVIDMAGDSILAVFETANGAVTAALLIQKALSTLAADVPPDRRMCFRIGVHMGDVIEKADGTVYGDGVNIAARLEGLALPGGVTVSDAVQGAVRNRVAASFEDLGEQQVKNIADPVRAYRVIAAAQGGATEGRGLPTSIMIKVGRSRSLAVAALVLALLLGAAAWLLRDRVLGGSAASLTGAPAFSIAVLPLSSPSGSPADTQLAERLTRELTHDLGHWRLASVASVDLAAAYRSKVDDPRAIGRELNVRHLVEGEVGRSGDNVTLTLRTIDSATGRQEWSDRMEFEPGLLEAEPMAMVMRTSAHLRRGINGAELSRAVREPDPRSAMNITLRGDAARTSGSEDLKGVFAARRLYDEALRLDPDFVRALVGRMSTLHWELYEDLKADRAQYLAEMDALSRRAVALDDQYSDAWAIRAETLLWLGRSDEAFAAAAYVQSVDPANLVFLWVIAWLTYASGRPGEAIALTQRAVAIDPPGNVNAAMNLCRANLMLGRYGDAMPACEKAATLDNDTWHNQLLLLAACVQNGEMQKAAVAKRQLLKRQPDFSIAKDKAAPLSDHPEYLKMLELHYYPALRRAGIPEH